MAEIGGQNPRDAAANLAAQYADDPHNVRALWLAGTVLRCGLNSGLDGATVCAMAGRSRVLYAKFAEVAAAAPNKPKKELADAGKAMAGLSRDYAVQCFDVAKSARASNDYGLAAQIFEAIYELTDKPAQLYNAARACELGSLWNEAAVYYTAYLALPGPWLDRRDAVAKLVGIQRRLASDAGDLVKQAQNAADGAKWAAQKADANASNAGAQAKAADQRAGNAEYRAQQAEQRAQQAEQRAQQADARAQQADQRAASAEAKARQAEQSAAEAQRRANDAATKAAYAAQRAEAAENRLNEVLRSLPQPGPAYPNRGR